MLRAGRGPELIGRRISELYPVLAGGELIAGYRRVVETGEPLVVPVLPYEDVIDGRSVSGFYTVQATRFEDGVLVASRDITPLETARLDWSRRCRSWRRPSGWRASGRGTSTSRRDRPEVSGEMQRIFGLRRRAVGDVELARSWR